MADAKSDNSLMATLKEPWPQLALALAVAVLLLCLVAGA